MRVNVRIERLILDGVDASPGDVRLMRATFERELASLLAKRADGLSEGSGGALDRARGRPFAFNAGAGSAALGRQIARSVNEVV